jgi:predicted RNA-binding protein with PUA-like domain
MANWLFKSEPSVWSFEMQAAAGAKGTDWSGIRNHSAKLDMMAMNRASAAFSTIPTTARRSSAS